jgi:hypothetical protein
MKRKQNRLFLLLALAALFWQCKQTYVSPYKSPPTGYLVVEGFITGNGPTRYTLTRSIELPGDSAIPAVTGAVVQVQGNDNSSWTLTDLGAGLYGIDTMALDPAATYRLHINTGSEEYLSDYVPYKATPPIDSISWINGSKGTQIYANTHDPANATHYYQWQYDETWEYHSAEVSNYEYDADLDSVVARPPADQAYKCWHSGSSTVLLINSSVKLAQDVIYQQPMELIPPNSEQISVLYSMLVHQYALTEDGYNYLALMKKNTESLGSIFDVQPSVLIGNIHCVNNPGEQVLGFVSAGSMQQQRIYIQRSEIPSGFGFSCPLPDTLAPKTQLKQFFYFGSYVPVIQGVFDGWLSNQKFCVDCRAQGGVNIKPSFWPN